MTDTDDDTFSAREIAQRRDAVIKRMLATPPKPHAKMKIGKRRAKAKKSRDAKTKAAR
jgi:hypothetical protein